MNLPEPQVSCPQDTIVLIIDDEESMRDACAEILIREGYQVLTAVDGDAGLALARENKPDIVFLDLKMPKMAGMAVLDELNIMIPDTVKVVITAYATVSSALEAIRHGAYDFLAKPFTPDELRVIAGRALERLSLLRRNRHLQAERDQAKRRFLELVTGEVRGPISAALANLKQLGQRLEQGAPESELAMEAQLRLEKLLALVDRWQS